MSFTVNPISAVLGGKITGLDLSRPMGDNLVAEIRQTWLDVGGLLVFPDQSLTTDQHIAFSRQFGPLQETVSRYYTPITRKSTAYPTRSKAANPRAAPEPAPIGIRTWRSRSGPRRRRSCTPTKSRTSAATLCFAT